MKRIRYGVAMSLDGYIAELSLDAVDGVDVMVIPVMLGGGVPLLPRFDRWTKLKLVGQKVYRSGTVSLRYEVVK